MKFEYSEPFFREYRKLPQSIRKKVDRVAQLLGQDIRHPGVRAKKVINADDIWEARVDLHVRMTFRIAGDTLIFRKVGTHAILRNP